MGIFCEVVSGASKENLNNYISYNIGNRRGTAARGRSTADPEFHESAAAGAASRTGNPEKGRSAMRLSVIVPARDEADVLRPCLESLLAQSEEGFRCRRGLGAVDGG